MPSSCGLPIAQSTGRPESALDYAVELGLQAGVRIAVTLGTETIAAFTQAGRRPSRSAVGTAGSSDHSCFRFWQRTFFDWLKAGQAVISV